MIGERRTKVKSKIKEILALGFITAIIAGIIYVIFAPEEDKYLAMDGYNDDDDDEFIVDDDSL